jgi:hypothetical protein
MLERCALRNGNVHSADGWRDILDPVIARYAGRDLGGRFFRADAAYAIPAIYERLEKAGYFYAIRPARERGAQGEDRASADPTGRTSVADQGQAVLRGFRVSGGVLGQAALRHSEDRMAPERAVPQSRLHRHQPADGA